MDTEQLAARFDKPAPGALVAVQALVNTVDVEEGSDELGSPAELVAWLRESGLGAAGIEAGEDDLEAVRRLRSALRAELDANGHGERPQAKGGLAELIGDVGVRLRAGADGALELDLEPATTVDGVLAQLVGISFRAQLAGEWQRLKLCQCADCAWAFYDGSRNRSGSWCTMEVCGNRIKNREYRRRHAADPV